MIFVTALSCLPLTTACAVEDSGSLESMTFGRADDVRRAQELWDQMASYRCWELMPGTEEFEPAGAPHGEFTRVFINDITEADTSDPANGSIIVKVNYQSQTEGDFDSITVMKKIAGYVPEAGDWFWVKYETDGGIAENAEGVPLAGRVGLGGTTGCIPCHDNAAGDDYLFTN